MRENAGLSVEMGIKENALRQIWDYNEESWENYCQSIYEK